MARCHITYNANSQKPDEILKLAVGSTNINNTVICRLGNPIPVFRSRDPDFSQSQRSLGSHKSIPKVPKFKSWDLLIPKMSTLVTSKSSRSKDIAD